MTRSKRPIPLLARRASVGIGNRLKAGLQRAGGVYQKYRNSIKYMYQDNFCNVCIVRELRRDVHQNGARKWIAKTCIRIAASGGDSGEETPA